MIVLNEIEWAKERLIDKQLGRSPYETLCRVAKLYIDQGHSKASARNMLEQFLLQCEPNASTVKWSGTLDNAVSRAAKFHKADIDHIIITDTEMNTIASLDGVQLRRLAFTLLCLAKYHIAANGQTDGWVNTKDSEIMRMANINTSIRRQSLMFHELNDLGLIRFSKKIDNTNVQVMFINAGNTAISLSDFRNLGYQYMMYTGHKEFFQCENCGMVVKRRGVQSQEMPQKSGRHQKYCSDCAIEVNVCNSINAAMQRRKTVHKTKNA